MLAHSPRVGRALMDELYERSQARQWGLTVEAFQAVLEVSVAHALGARSPGPGEVERYLTSLHLADLALATACAAGHEAAWEAFIREYRPILTRAADAIDPGGGARELADALYADLYGLRETGGARQSLFRYFHGRSSLATWLRAVLSQRLVDRARVAHRTAPLGEEDDAPLPDPRPSTPDPERPRFFEAVRRALASAVGALDARDRVRLGLYYVQRLTLAEIGQLLKEHEASVSRHLTRVRGALRTGIERELRERERMTDAEIAECLRSVVDDPGALDLQALVGELPGGKNVRDNRSRE